MADPLNWQMQTVTDFKGGRHQVQSPVINTSNFNVVDPNGAVQYPGVTPEEYQKAKKQYETAMRASQQFASIGDKASAARYAQSAQAIKSGIDNRRKVADLNNQKIAAAQRAEANAKGYESRQIDPAAYSLMRQAAEGNAPSQAEMMMRRQAGQMYNQSLSAANSARSYNPALARAAMFANAGGQADLAQRAGEVRAGEMANARSALGQYALGQQGQNDQSAMAMRGISQGYQGMQQQGGMQYTNALLNQANMVNNAALGWATGRAQADAAEENAYANRLNAGANVAGAINPFKSDSRTKENIQPIGSNLKIADMTSFNQIEPTPSSSGPNAYDAFMSDVRSKQNVEKIGSVSDQFAQVTPVTYDYKPEYGGGSHVGVVAQDLERTPVGKMMVSSKDTGKGKGMKQIDGQAAVSALLANAAEQAKRIKGLEVQLGRAQMSPQVEIGQAQLSPRGTVFGGQARELSDDEINQLLREEASKRVQIGPARNVHRVRKMTGRDY